MTTLTGATPGRQAWRVAIGTTLVLGACVLGPPRADRATPTVFLPLPNVADSMVKANGRLRGVQAAQDLPEAFRVVTTVVQTIPQLGLRCPLTLVDDRDGTTLRREAEQQYLKTASPPSSVGGYPVRTADRIVGYYSVRPIGRYGVDSSHWLRVGCATAPTRSDEVIGTVHDTQPAVPGQTEIPARVRAALDRFPSPTTGMPSIAIRFVRDTIRVGELVELVTVTWFPRALRDRLRRLAGVTSPSLSGMASVRTQELPIAAGIRNVDGELYDRYVSWQVIEALGRGRVAASPAVLTYRVPASANFAPEQQDTVRSSSTVLEVRPRD